MIQSTLGAWTTWSRTRAPATSCSVGRAMMQCGAEKPAAKSIKTSRGTEAHFTSSRRSGTTLCIGTGSRACCGRGRDINKTRASTLSDRRARVHRCECGSCCPCAVDDSMDYGVCVDDPDDDATASPVCVDMRQSGWTASAGTNLRNQRVTDLLLTDHHITCDLNVTGASPQSTPRRPAAIMREHVFRRRYGGDGADVETRDARFEYRRDEISSTRSL